MNHKKIIRAWKDPEYRAALSESERAELPDSPAGVSGLDDDMLADVQGGVTEALLTLGCTPGTGNCGGLTYQLCSLACSGGGGPGGSLIFGTCMLTGCPGQI